ncbi:MAG: NAD(P)/FAD-dependent oxidoreductase [Terracoccus sp.]
MTAHQPDPALHPALHPAASASSYDVVVIGGGAGGLSTALTLGRALRRVLVVDSGQPRNAPAAEAHNYLTRDGVAPLELLRLGRADVQKYGNAVVSDEVSSARAEGDGFVVTLAAGGDVSARRLVVATGLRDELPEIDGLAEHWGTGVLHCPYCHGYEVRGRRVAVIGVGPASAHQALMWSQWTDHLTYVEHDAPLDDAQREQLEALGVTVVPARAVAVTGDGTRLTGIHADDGSTVAVSAVVVGAPVSARLDGLEGLGLVARSWDMMGASMGTHLPTDAMGATEVAGVWAVGNVTDPAAQVITAAAAGARVAAMVNMSLITADADAAVAAVRNVRATRSDAVV